MNNLIVCTKCKVAKKESEYWFDKRRGKVRNPCAECSKCKRASLTTRLKYANNKISRSDVINHYNKKDLPEEVLLFFTDLLLLNRAIKKMEKPLLKSDGINTYIFCPICGEFESIELPCEIQNLVEIGTIFTKIHKHNDI
jgi:hypothetical protein